MSIRRRPTKSFGRFLPCLFLTTTLTLCGAEPGLGTVEVVTDLLHAFDQATVRDSSSCEVRRPGSSGGVRMDALFAHPATTQRPARVEYDLALPAVTAADLLLLTFEIALSDGIKADHPYDGVRFSVEVDGRELFARPTREMRWRPCAVDLTAFAGRRVKLALLTAAMETTNYDWSQWGNPRLVLVRRQAEVTVAAAGWQRLPISTGIVTADLRPDADVTLRLRPVGGTGTVREIRVPRSDASAAGPSLVALNVDFGSADATEVEVLPADALIGGHVLVASYAPRVRVEKPGAAHALVRVGDTVPLRVMLRNEGQGRLTAQSARVSLEVGGQSLPEQPVPALAPGESSRAEWTWQAPNQASRVPMTARIKSGDRTNQSVSDVEVLARDNPTLNQAIENEHVRLEFVRQPDGFSHARIFARQPSGWVQVAVWKPLFRMVAETHQGESMLEVRPIKPSVSRRGNQRSIQLRGTASDLDGAEWQVGLTVTLRAGESMAHLVYEWRANRARQVKTLLGPNLYVGDGPGGDAKTWGLFPGLEYLNGAERSSNERDFTPRLADRRTPHPHKITAPLMAVTIGPDSQAPHSKPDRFFTPDSLKDQRSRTDRASAFPVLASEVTVALLWDPLKPWDGEHAFPSTRFASPNFDEGMANHRMALFLPATPNFVAENETRAAKPYPLAANQPLTLDASLVVARGPVTTAMRAWLDRAGGLPKPSPWPRTFQEELDLCRTGFLSTVGDATTGKFRHCIDWRLEHSPGMAALLWLDSHLATNAAGRTESRERVELAARNMLRDGGAPVFQSQAACHIMQWEFPFYYGHLPETMAAVDNQIRGLMQSQETDGGWRYHPGNAEQADLGQAGDSVLGTCAVRAAALLRHARITGDTHSLAAGEKALRFMEQFRVPRGGQTWECPMYEPDILAAAYAIRAYHDAWRATGNARWLHNAVYWAESGVPFIYLWSLPDKPMMLGATIPVFGSTFYTHTWLAVPVQWCGLVYAYHVLNLAADLRQTRLPKTDSPLPLALNLTADDWRRVVELITVSGMHQQFADGDKVGTYPDSISRFEQKNGAFINPEDILVNVLALQGHSPDVKTARLRRSGLADVVVSSGATIENLRSGSREFTFDLVSFPGEPSHALIAGLKPTRVRVGGAELPKASAPTLRDPGWWWDERTGRLYLTVPAGQGRVTVQVIE